MPRRLTCCSMPFGDPWGSSHTQCFFCGFAFFSVVFIFFDEFAFFFVLFFFHEILLFFMKAKIYKIFLSSKLILQANIASFSWKWTSHPWCLWVMWKCLQKKKNNNNNNQKTCTNIFTYFCIKYYIFDFTYIAHFFIIIFFFFGCLWPEISQNVIFCSFFFWPEVCQNCFFCRSSFLENILLFLAFCSGPTSVRGLLRPLSPLFFSCTWPPWLLTLSFVPIWPTECKWSNFVCIVWVLFMKGFTSTTNNWGQLSLRSVRNCVHTNMNRARSISQSMNIHLQKESPDFFPLQRFLLCAWMRRSTSWYADTEARGNKFNLEKDQTHFFAQKRRKSSWWDKFWNGAWRTHSHFFHKNKHFKVFNFC